MITDVIFREQLLFLEERGQMSVFSDPSAVIFGRQGASFKRQQNDGREVLNWGGSTLHLQILN